MTTATTTPIGKPHPKGTLPSVNISSRMEEEEDEFFFPKKTVSLKKRKLSHSEPQQIPTSNSFEKITPEDSNMEEIEPDEEEVTPVVLKNIPPVVLEGIKANLEKIQKGVNNICQSKTTYKFNKDLIYIYTTTKEDYESLISYLKAKNRTFYTHTPAWNKTKKIVLKGLPNLNDDKEIIKELEEHGIHCKEVKIIKKKTAEMPDTPVRLLHLELKTNIKDVKKINHLFYTRIKWEDYVNKKGIAQCHRCQGFGHGTNGCFLQPYCVKCAGNHLTADCTKDEKTPPTCVNCGGEHPASYSQCIVATKYRNRKFTKNQSPHKQTAIPQHKSASSPPPVTPKEFPLLKGQQINHTRPPTPAWTRTNSPSTPDNLSSILELQQEINTLHQLCDVNELLEDLRKLNQALAQCQTKGQRLLAVLNATK